MLIKSDFKDYYDVGMGLGVDSSLIYYRYTEIDKYEEMPFPKFCRNYYGDVGKKYVNVETLHIGFCGKIYPVLRVNKPGEKWDVINQRYEDNVSAYCYNLESVDRFIEKYFPKEYEEYQQKTKFDFKGGKWTYGLRREVFKKFFEADYGKVANSYLDRAPIFLAKFVAEEFHERGEVALNTQLKQYEFYRIHDAYQTYQQLSMFISNIAQPNKPIPKITNDTMIESKGFNLKYSFRKEKTLK